MLYILIIFPSFFCTYDQDIAKYMKTWIQVNWMTENEQESQFLSKSKKILTKEIEAVEEVMRITLLLGLFFQKCFGVKVPGWCCVLWQTPWKIVVYHIEYDLAQKYIFSYLYISLKFNCVYSTCIISNQSDKHQCQLKDSLKLHKDDW